MKLQKAEKILLVKKDEKKKIGKINTTKYFQNKIFLKKLLQKKNNGQ